MNSENEDVFNPESEEAIESGHSKEQAENDSDSESADTLEEKLQQEKAELNDKYIRLFAEFDNYKRRTQKERIELFQTAGKDIIISLLPVLDDFDRAVKAMETATDIVSIREGVLLIQTKLNNILTQKGLKEIESTNTSFNTDLHEAITNIPAPTDAQKGTVIDTAEKGYSLNDKVIRFAKVVVGS